MFSQRHEPIPFLVLHRPLFSFGSVLLCLWDMFRFRSGISWLEMRDIDLTNRLCRVQTLVGPRLLSAYDVSLTASFLEVG
jgi:hypothetical protein